MSLERYFQRVWHWWWLILLCTFMAAVASYVASSRQPYIYQTSTSLRVGGEVTRKSNPGFQDFEVPDQLARSYAQVVRQEPILQATIDSLELPISWNELQGQVFAAPVEGTQLLGITVQDTSPKRAVAIADEIAHQLIAQSPTSPENKARQEQSEFVKSQLNDLKSRMENAKARVEELRVELDNTLSARQIQDLQTEIANLEDLINTWQSNYTDLLGFLEGGDSPNTLAVVEPAILPTKPVSPNIPLNVALAAVAAFMLSLGAAIVIEYFDDTIKSSDELKAFLGSNVLGSVSRMKGVDYQGKLITAQNSFAPSVEAFRLLRINVLYTGEEPAVKCMMVASPNSGEGKSLITANLGMTLAQADLKTVIVDADLRRPIMHKIFQLSNSEGLTDLLRSATLNIDSQLKSTPVDNLRVITSGPLPPNPAELVGSQHMATLLKRLSGIADIVILDSSPILAVSDAVVLANRVGHVILVVEAGRTRQKAIKQALARLHQAGAKVMGSILNRASGKDWGYANYANYSRSYPNAVDPSGQPAQRRWWQRLPAFK